MRLWCIEAAWRAVQDGLRIKALRHTRRGHYRVESPMTKRPSGNCYIRTVPSLPRFSRRKPSAATARKGDWRALDDPEPNAHSPGMTGALAMDCRAHGPGRFGRRLRHLKEITPVASGRVAAVRLTVSQLPASLGCRSISSETISTRDKHQFSDAEACLLAGTSDFPFSMVDYGPVEHSSRRQQKYPEPFVSTVSPCGGSPAYGVVIASVVRRRHKAHIQVAAADIERWQRPGAMRSRAPTSGMQPPIYNDFFRSSPLSGETGIVTVFIFMQTYLRNARPGSRCSYRFCVGGDRCAGNRSSLS